MTRSSSLAVKALLALLSLIPLPSYALDLDLTLQKESALTRLTNDDKTKLKSVAKIALETGSDSSSHVWNNTNTGHAGVITILSSEQRDNLLCRKARFINTAGELTSTTFVTLCKSENKWSEVSPRSTTTESNEITSSSTSDMFNEPNNTNEMQAKSLGETSARCQQLARDIKNSIGKPIRRNAAIELHKLECERISN